VRRSLRALAVVVLVGAVHLGLAVPAGAAEITSPTGPLTRIETTPDLNCAVNRIDDTAGEWFGNTGCGTLVATGGTLYGPTNIPAGSGAGPRTPFTPVSQTGPTGAGTAANPFRLVTVVDAGVSLRITQTDTYVAGEESYRTDLSIANISEAPTTAIVYRAGDCFLQDDDQGFGDVDTESGAVACTTSNEPGGRIQQLFPISPGSAYMEGGFSEVWSRIGLQQPFPNTCRCGEFIDNGVGLSWSIALPTAAPVTLSHLVTFSPLGRRPLSTDKVAQSASSPAGGTNGYTIIVENPNTAGVTLSSITDTLPAGFTYVPGSSEGATTANPTIVGRDLTWNGSFPIAGGGTTSLSFDVTVGTTAGQHFNNAGATATGGFSVAPTGPTAPITVGGGGGPPNDDFAAGAPLTGSTGSVTGTNAGATRQTGEPVHFAAGTTSIWYRWTPAASGLATIDTVGSAFDTLLAAYTGSTLTGLTRVAADGDSAGNLRSRIRFPATAGVTYHLALDGAGGASGATTLRFALDAAPVASAGADVTVTPGSHVDLDGSASSDPGGGALAFAWLQVGGPRAVLENGTTARPRVRGLSQPGTYTFVLTVTDTGGQEATDEVVITVRTSSK
jgi:uncharacterized repeat protein (TIGR01451 family)